MLFWAEGDKHRNSVRLSNSDPDLLRLFVTFLRDCYDADVARIAVTCYLFADHLERQREVENSGCERSDFRGHVFASPSSTSTRNTARRNAATSCRMAPARLLTPTTRRRSPSSARSRSTRASTGRNGSASRRARRVRSSRASVDGHWRHGRAARFGRRRPSPTSRGRRPCASRPATASPRR
jgi:hypothetical protein